jgi:hypothetical protein
VRFFAKSHSRSLASPPPLLCPLSFIPSLKEIQKCFMKGCATKNDFENALRSHKESKDEMRSDQREAADAFYGHN